MRSEDKEYRQRNHRPSYQHENPVEEHRDIMTRICSWDKSDQPAQPVEFDPKRKSPHWEKRKPKRDQ
jgi:hypothetical protein